MICTIQHDSRDLKSLFLEVPFFGLTPPFIKKQWCIEVVEHPIRIETQEHNRYRFWGKIDELDGKILRVITLEDKKTIHNAFPDRRFKHEN